MIKIGISGCPSTGKTTLARSLCSKIKNLRSINNLEMVSEYARAYTSKHGEIEHMWEQKRILEKQLEWENSVVDKVDLIVTDSPIHLGFLYAITLPKKNEKDIMLFNDIFKELTKLSLPKPRYDFIFHLPLGVPPKEDGVRLDIHLDDKWRTESDFIIRSIFKIFPPKKFVALESLELQDRVDECMGHLNDCI